MECDIIKIVNRQILIVKRYLEITQEKITEIKENHPKNHGNQQKITEITENHAQEMAVRITEM
jgi:hypothetical protein